MASDRASNQNCLQTDLLGQSPVKPEVIRAMRLTIVADRRRSRFPKVSDDAVARREGDIPNCSGNLQDPGKLVFRRVGILPQQLRTSLLFPRRSKSGSSHLNVFRQAQVAQRGLGRLDLGFDGWVAWRDLELDL